MAQPAWSAGAISTTRLPSCRPRLRALTSPINGSSRRSSMWWSPSGSERTPITVPDTGMHRLIVWRRSGWYTLASGSPGRHADAGLAGFVDGATGGAEVFASASMSSSGKANAVVDGVAGGAVTAGWVAGEVLFGSDFFRTPRWIGSPFL